MSSRNYFDVEKKEQFIIYHDMEMLKALDYDPIQAIRRMEMALENKDATIAQLQDQISNLHARLNEEISKSQDAVEKIRRTSESNDIVRTQEVETRARLKQALSFIHNIMKYGHKHPR